MENNTPMTHQEQNNDEIDLLALAGTLWDGRWLIIGVTVLATLFGAVYALLAEPVYRADAMVQVEQKSGGLPGMSEITEMFGSESAAVTEIELIKSRAVMGETVDALHLDIEIEPVQVPVIGNFLSRYASYGPDGLAEPWWSSNYAWGGEKLDITRFEVPRATYGDEYTLKVTESGWLLENEAGIEVLGGVEGEQANNGNYSLFVQSVKARPGTRFTLIKRDRLAKIIELQQNVGASEKGKDSGIIVLSYPHPKPAKAKAVLDHITQTYVRNNVERNSAEASSSLEYLKERLPDVRKDLEEAEAKLNEYQVEAESVNVTAEAQAVLDQIVELEKNISTLQLQKAEIERKFTSSHPNYKAWQAQMAELQERKKELDERISKLPLTQQKVVRLTRDVKVGNEIYLQMLANIQELDIVRAGTVGNVRVVDDAAVNIDEPVKPKKSLLVAVCLVLGGMLSAGFVLLQSILNRGVETPEQIESLGIPVYATVPLSKEQSKLNLLLRKEAEKNIHLLALDNPADLAIEALRGLRTSLYFAMMDAPNNILMVSGPSPNVGKSFVSANFAAVFAQSDKRVLVVDADLRRGSMHDQFNMDKKLGLSEVLSRQIDLKDAIRETKVKGLHFISRGVAPPNPSELLMSSSFEQFVEEIKVDYDLIIIDTPPILAVTDAAIIGRHAGTSMIVVRFEMNPAKEIELTKARFGQNGVDIKGAVFNAVEQRARTKTAYGYYNYDYKSERH
ncbi:tyrosine protein kinase [Alcanivorax sp. HI0033]|uniref:polysaccharide biosynthesis tyrosine autokinase n=1 Tax=unclassified Alcanivorax TaxID=2638842 RepID=UPI0007B7B24C|nr:MULTISPECIES: polysaccharide biosynthesis tyrosine autokinase [unclassified Alcanivorax]KZX74058.1 tyrosine protein kinase [Alcanivorax sp. HI0013]KZX85152.1 tyrosine protein kinase [Alcanivorax sp. HI0011]KZY19959.1 tyrosine protein kinase [Alcanivorax sp. HI0035]KZX66285.1 tyrosine protein kinase [Alcanivorax sp. HI0007]KZX70768.1 tyrosine protein kinase [Alcanivorax sp. HI0003]